MMASSITFLLCSPILAGTINAVRVEPWFAQLQDVRRPLGEGEDAMVDVFEVAELIAASAVARYGDEVDLIAYYGSQARGDARPGSDLDFFYTPAEGKNPPIGRTFLLDGLLFDFWGLRWETLEGFATGATRGWAFAPALVRQATPLYVRSPEQADRLAKLKAQSLALESPAKQTAMAGRAQDCFPRVLEQLGALRLAARGSRADVTSAGWRLIGAAWECLALANQVTFERGFHRALAETDRMASRPANLQELVRAIATSSDVDDVLRAADELVAAVYRIQRDRKPAPPATASVRERFDQAYPEMKDIVRKLLEACEAGDRVAASLEAFSLQSDIASMLSDASDRLSEPHAEQSAALTESGFPDLMALVSGPLDTLAEAAGRFDAHLRDWLGEHDVDLCEFAMLDELRDVLR